MPILLENHHEKNASASSKRRINIAIKLAKLKINRAKKNGKLYAKIDFYSGEFHNDGWMNMDEVHEVCHYMAKKGITNYSEGNSDGYIRIFEW